MKPQRSENYEPKKIGLDEAKEILRKDYLCRTSGDCSGISCAECDYRVLPNEMEPALLAVLTELGVEVNES